MDFITIFQTYALNVHLIHKVRKLFPKQKFQSLFIFLLLFFNSGIYPNCECDDKMHTFSAYINECYIGCNGGIGKHPYCDCGIGMFYNTEEFKCESNIGRACPKQSIGTGPDCLCIEMNKTFIESLWSCLDHTVTFAFSSSTNCPDRSQKYPQCSGIDPNALKSLIG